MPYKQGLWNDFAKNKHKTHGDGDRGNRVEQVVQHEWHGLHSACIHHQHRDEKPMRIVHKFEDASRAAS